MKKMPSLAGFKSATLRLYVMLSSQMSHKDRQRPRGINHLNRLLLCSTCVTVYEDVRVLVVLVT